MDAHGMVVFAGLVDLGAWSRLSVRGLDCVRHDGYWRTLLYRPSRRFSVHPFSPSAVYSLFGMERFAAMGACFHRVGDAPGLAVGIALPTAVFLVLAGDSMGVLRGHDS